VRRHLRMLRTAARDVLHALVRLLALLLVLLAWLWRRILTLFGRKTEKGNRRVPCVPVPAHIRRKPDPCLYSQRFIMERFPGTPVTWNNPDIWLTEQDDTPVDSHQLEPNHTYIVHGRIHDASFDPARATQVRCYYRPFGKKQPEIRLVSAFAVLAVDRLRLNRAVPGSGDQSLAASARMRSAALAATVRI